MLFSNDLYYTRTFYMLSSLLSVATIAILILSIWLFYKKGIQYIEKYKELPKLKDSHYYLITAGVISPFILCFLPLIGQIVQVFYLVLVFVAYSNILSFKDPKKMKPEKLVLLSAGMGLCGIFGFVIGILRGISDQKESEENPQIKEKNENN